MKPLIDSFQLSIDPKGRIVLPVIYREHFKAGAIISARADHLRLYSPQDFFQLVDRVKDARTQLHEGRTLLGAEAAEVLTSNASEANVDSQGRLVIKPAIRERIGLGARVHIAGSIDHVTIRPVTEDTPDVAAVFRQLESLGL